MCGLRRICISEMDRIAMSEWASELREILADGWQWRLRGCGSLCLVLGFNFILGFSFHFLCLVILMVGRKINVLFQW